MAETTMTGEGLDERRRRLRYRAWHRGFQEMDLVMGRFVDAGVAAFTDSELADFERLIDVPDHEIYDWVMGKTSVPAEFDTALFGRMRDFHLEGPR
ncbi:MAG: succinate dehydrogenase assembly factor 2 [Xanthobacteraceae bacterium]|jgi:antitoxin CptB|nr:succinate dehydrogenase assembly factor 2 [Xanthobacteraceae bacterium]